MPSEIQHEIVEGERSPSILGADQRTGKWRPGPPPTAVQVRLRSQLPRGLGLPVQEVRGRGTAARHGGEFRVIVVAEHAGRRTRVLSFGDQLVFLRHSHCPVHHTEHQRRAKDPFLF